VSATLTFLGAAGTVTGSRHLLDDGRRRVLMDCGLFQGLKELRLRNWAPLGVEPTTLEAVLLSHAHIDHSGYLPRLVRAGYRGPIFATPATRDLCAPMLEDVAMLQEADARHIARLIERAAPPVKEVLLALNATVDGQTTAHYVTDLLHEGHVKVTRLAHGVPVGGELDYLDDGTLAAALRQRTPF